MTSLRVLKCARQCAHIAETHQSEHEQDAGMGVSGAP
jgi:hypothetical protein